ncbi:hypothetical protein SNEBB_003609 [Seison nebaliae]|nr:hypothetical protein SNEBB_003609 [Seison nebaliae]
MCDIKKDTLPPDRSLNDYLERIDKKFNLMNNDQKSLFKEEVRLYRNRYLVESFRQSPTDVSTKEKLSSEIFSTYKIGKNFVNFNESQIDKGKMKKDIRIF